MKIYVIAGTGEQARQWINKDIESRAAAGDSSVRLTDYCYVTGPDSFRGARDPHGVFVGTWKERADILDIVELLMAQSIHVNRKLEAVLRDVRQMKKPTLKRVAGGWINTNIAIQMAAEELAKEIDKHIIEEIRNGGNIPTQG